MHEALAGIRRWLSAIIHNYAHKKIFFTRYDRLEFFSNWLIVCGKITHLSYKTGYFFSSFHLYVKNTIKNTSYISFGENVSSNQHMYRYSTSAWSLSKRFFSYISRYPIWHAWSRFIDREQRWILIARSCSRACKT